MKANTALFMMLPVPSEPLAPPLPTCSVPLEIIVAPEYVFRPARTCVPLPLITRETPPLPSPIEPLKIAVPPLGASVSAVGTCAAVGSTAPWLPET